MSRRLRTAWRAVASALLVVPALFLITPTAAMACSCVESDTEDLLGYADTVVVGELTGAQPPPTRADGNVSSDDRVTYTVALDAVFQGDPENPLTFRSASHGASCGLEDMQVGSDYVFFVRDGQSGLCDGTSRATAALIAEVEAVTGPGEPVAAPDPTTASDPTMASDPVTAPQSAPDAEPEPAAPWFLWPGLGVGTVGLLALGWLLWRRSTD